MHTAPVTPVRSIRTGTKSLIVNNANTRPIPTHTSSQIRFAGRSQYILSAAPSTKAVTNIPARFKIANTIARMIPAARPMIPLSVSSDVICIATAAAAPVPITKTVRNDQNLASFNPKKQLRIPSNTVIPSEISTISASLSAIPSRSNAVGKTSFSCSHLPISFIISIVPLPYYLNLSIATYILPTFSERYNRKMDANLLF